MSWYRCRVNWVARKKSVKWRILRWLGHRTLTQTVETLCWYCTYHRAQLLYVTCWIILMMKLQLILCFNGFLDLATLQSCCVTCLNRVWKTGCDGFWSLSWCCVLGRTAETVWIAGGRGAATRNDSNSKRFSATKYRSGRVTAWTWTSW